MLQFEVMTCSIYFRQNCYSTSMWLLPKLAIYCGFWMLHQLMLNNSNKH